MLVTIDLSILIFFCFPFVICSLSTDISKIADVKDTEILRTIIKHNEADINVASLNHVDDIGNKKTSEDKNNGQLPIPIAEKHDFSTPKTRNKVISQIAMEGGGVIQQASTLGNPNQAGILTEIDESEHAKGSKGRKGVLDQFPSVVARKGVDPDGTEDHFSVGGNNSSGKSVAQSAKESSSIPGSTEKPELLNTTKDQTHVQSNQLNEKNIGVQKISHAKKSEVVSDVGDTEDYDQYLIIKTSTTGEDYVIIGVVIVIGIWFSVFGALIFYRRAGEYWDRRHYRRMDFLVEGMYND
uniref:Uncharacterized protein n=1 Tax=Cuerna arida TaxID=1464854 RepID=A0A1B6F8F7_9HEMI